MSEKTLDFLVCESSRRSASPAGFTPLTTEQPPREGNSMKAIKISAIIAGFLLAPVNSGLAEPTVEETKEFISRVGTGLCYHSSRPISVELAFLNDEVVFAYKEGIDRTFTAKLGLLDRTNILMDYVDGAYNSRITIPCLDAACWKVESDTGSGTRNYHIFRCNDHVSSKITGFVKAWKHLLKTVGAKEPLF